MNSLRYRQEYIEKNRRRWQGYTDYSIFPDDPVNGAVLVESRPLKGIGDVIRNHISHLPISWGLTIFTGMHHLQFFHDETAPIKNIDFKALEGFGWEADSVNAYNKLLVSPGFWQYLAEKYPSRVLLFQHDSLLLRDGVESFLRYDYVGAPWKFQDYGGNGGLSLRNPTKMLDVIKKFSCPAGMNEDVFFSNHLLQVGGRLASRETCSRFSVESIFQLDTMGLHDVEEWLSDQEVEQIYNQYNLI